MEEVDFELSAMCDTLLYTCGCCGKIDMHGMPLVEEMNGQFVMAGVLCRTCVKDKFITLK